MMYFMFVKTQTYMIGHIQDAITSKQIKIVVEECSEYSEKEKCIHQ